MFLLCDANRRNYSVTSIGGRIVYRFRILWLIGVQSGRRLAADLIGCCCAWYKTSLFVPASNPACLRFLPSATPRRLVGFRTSTTVR